LPIIFGVVGFLAIGGTIAVNQSTHIFDNLFHVDEATHIDFIETFDSPDDWQPCQEIPKTAIARNEEGVTVNLRLKYDEYWLSKDGEDMPLQKDGDSIAIINFQNQADWEDGGDGWYYYKHQLAPGDE
jgi:alternate signal-mediated exported protein